MNNMYVKLKNYKTFNDFLEVGLEVKKSNEKLGKEILMLAKYLMNFNDYNGTFYQKNFEKEYDKVLEQLRKWEEK